MSASNLRAHGGSKELLGANGDLVNSGKIVTNTKFGKQMDITAKHLDYLITNTTGLQSGSSAMDGVLLDTKQGTHFAKVPNMPIVEKSKTPVQKFGQVQYAKGKK